MFERGGVIECGMSRGTHMVRWRADVTELFLKLYYNYKIFEVPVLVFSRAYGHAVAKKPWVRGWSRTWTTS